MNSSKSLPSGLFPRWLRLGIFLELLKWKKHAAMLRGRSRRLKWDAGICLFPVCVCGHGQKLGLHNLCAQGGGVQQAFV